MVQKVGLVTLTNTIGRKSSESTAGTNATGSVFSYDPMGRVLNNSQCTPQNCSGTPFSLAYTYDLLGDVLTSTNGAGVTLTGAYNLGARLTSLTSSLSDANHPGTLFGYTNIAHYNAAGSLLSVTLGNNVNETRTYDTRLRLASIADGTVYTVTIPSSGGYAPNSDILAANDSVNGNWNYAYDGFNRLCASNQGGQTSLLCTSTNNTGQVAFTYAYDRFGNRWNQTVSHGSGPAPSYAFDNNSRITGTTGVGYDAAGDMTGDGTTTYTFDAEGRIATAVNAANGTSTYLYDAEGRRVRKTTSSGSVDFVYDLGGHEVAAVTSGGSWTRGEVYAGERHLVTYLSSPMTYFVYSDWLGSERFRTPYVPSTNETCTNLPFGDGMNCSGTDVSPMHFTAKERDSESNLDNFGARYDSSSIGRFTSPDPMGGHQEDPQTLNKYAYVRNNPTTLTDPTGLDIWLQGCGKENTSTCQNNYVGTTDKDGNFTRTHLTGDQTQDATLGAHGISVTQDGKTYEGVWDTNKGENGAVTVAGAEGTPLEGYDAKINGNCGNTCVASGTIFNASNPNASTAALFSVLDAKGSGYVKEAGLDFMDKFHPGATNFRGHTAGDPHGIPSTHIPIDPKASTPQLGFHIDKSFPYDSPGDFAEHTGSVIHTLWNEITGQQ